MYVDIPSEKDNYFIKNRCCRCEREMAGYPDRLKLHAPRKAWWKCSTAPSERAACCMPYGGKYQLTETQAMVAKLPVLEGKTDTVTMMAYGFDPYLSSWSPYHGAVYAVVESIARIVAGGGDYQQDPFHFPGVFP